MAQSEKIVLYWTGEKMTCAETQIDGSCSVRSWDWNVPWYSKIHARLLKQHIARPHVVCALGLDFVHLQCTQMRSDLSYDESRQYWEHQRRASSSMYFYNNVLFGLCQKNMSIIGKIEKKFLKNWMCFLKSCDIVPDMLVFLPIILIQFLSQDKENHLLIFQDIKNYIFSFSNHGIVYFFKHIKTTDSIIDLESLIQSVFISGLEITKLDKLYTAVDSEHVEKIQSLKIFREIKISNIYNETKNKIFLDSQLLFNLINHECI